MIQRHNEVRDLLGDLASLVWSQLKREPVVNQADEAMGTPALIADMAVKGKPCIIVFCVDRKVLCKL